MDRPQEHATSVVRRNRRRYEALVDMAEHHAARGDVERVLRSAVFAANYAWYAPVGAVTDLRLERAVVHAVRGSGTVTTDPDRHTGRVLHVLSEAFATGGHTRQVCAWMRRDERTSDVVLTNQLGPVPDRLIDAVRTSGGQLRSLRDDAPEFLDRAHALRAEMNRADLVVLTVHPYDAIALAAVNLPGVRPPVVFANHADHTFWLGVGGADVVCDWRTHIRPLDIGMRGVPEDRIEVLPLPMDPAVPAADDGLRTRLGIRPDATVAVTVTAHWKVAPAWGRGMHQLVDRTLHWSPKLSVVLVGVSPTGEWARLQKRYPGRVFPVGTVPDAAPYLALADIFLESYPMRAGTTPLEAAMAGLPVVALADLPEDSPAHIFQTGSPGLDGLPVLASAEKFAVAVHRLTRDPELRRTQGEEVRAAVQALHAGPGWLSRLEAVYQRARELPAMDVDDLVAPPIDEQYGITLVRSTAMQDSPDPRQMVSPLGDLLDENMSLDLFASLERELGPSLHLRVTAGWEDHADWTPRLLGLAATHPRLRVSLPFAAGDDVQGSRTTDLLVGMITSLGYTTANCGDIHVESAGPASAVPAVSGELPFSPEALDWLERLLSSPCWEPATTPVAAGVA